MLSKFTQDAEGTCTWKLQQLQTPFDSGSTCWLGTGDLASALCNEESTVKQPEQEQCPDDTVNSGCLQSERKIVYVSFLITYKNCTYTHCVSLKSNVASTPKRNMFTAASSWFPPLLKLW